MGEPEVGVLEGAPSQGPVDVAKTRSWGSRRGFWYQWAWSGVVDMISCTDGCSLWAGGWPQWAWSGAGGLCLHRWAWSGAGGRGLGPWTRFPGGWAPSQGPSLSPSPPGLPRAPPAPCLVCRGSLPPAGPCERCCSFCAAVLQGASVVPLGNGPGGGLCLVTPRTRPRGLQCVACFSGNLGIDEGPCTQSYFSEVVQSSPWYFCGASVPTLSQCLHPMPTHIPGPLPCIPHAIPTHPCPQTHTSLLTPHVRGMPWACENESLLVCGLPRKTPLLWSPSLLAGGPRPAPQRPLVHSLIQQKSGCTGPGSLHPRASFQPGLSEGVKGVPALGQIPSDCTAGGLSGLWLSVGRAGCGDQRWGSPCSLSGLRLGCPNHPSLQGTGGLRGVSRAGSLWTLGGSAAPSPQRQDRRPRGQGPVPTMVLPREVMWLDLPSTSGHLHPLGTGMACSAHQGVTWWVGLSWGGPGERATVGPTGPHGASVPLWGESLSAASPPVPWVMIKQAVVEGSAGPRSLSSGSTSSPDLRRPADLGAQGPPAAQLGGARAGAAGGLAPGLPGHPETRQPVADRTPGQPHR